jgi:site-specific recombinase XerD
MPSNVELIEQFAVFKGINQGRAPRTVDMYIDTLQRLNTSLQNRSFLEATSDELTFFLGPQLHQAGVHALSRRPHVAAVREFYRWLYKHQRLIGANPTSSITYPKSGKSLPLAITLANAEKLMWSIDFRTFQGVRDAAMLAILIGCGLRISGLLSLCREQVEPSIIDGKPRLQIRVREKGDRERLVPVPEDAALMLRVYMDHPDLQAIDARLEDGRTLLFVSTKNTHCPPHEFHGARRRLNRKTVREMIQRRGKALGIPIEQLHPHAMRHLFGTELAEGDVDILQRQGLMGHAQASSTAIYEQVAIRKKFAAIDKAGPLSKMKTPVTELLQRLNQRKETPK